VWAKGDGGVEEVEKSERLHPARAMQNGGRRK